METDGGKVNWKAAIELDASLDGLDQLGSIRMAWVETRVCIDDANNRPRESVLSIPESLDENFAEEQREMRITVRRESLTKAAVGGDGSGNIVVGRKLVCGCLI